LLLLGICAGFCNENNTLIGIMLICVTLLFAYIRKIEVNKSFYYAFIGFCIGAALLFSAPGIWARQAVASDITFWDIKNKIMILPSIIAFHIYASYISCIILLIVMPLLVHKIYITRDKKHNFVSNLFAEYQFSAALIMIFISLLLSLVFGGVGVLPAVRAYYSVPVCMAFAVVLMIDLLFRKYKCKKTIFALITILCCYSAFILLEGSSDFLSINEDQKKRNIEIAQQKRNGIKDLHVSQHRIVREKLFQFIWMEDIVSDKNFWLNKRAAKYYQVESISCRNEIKPNLYFWGSKNAVKTDNRDKSY